MVFDGKKTQDEILTDLKSRILALGRAPVLAAIWVGEDEVTARYVEIKQKVAEKLGIRFDLIKFPANEAEHIVAEKIKLLNNDTGVDGVMVQIPLPKNINQDTIIRSIVPEKDVDGLRYCANLTCGFFPPVVGAIVMALETAHQNIYDKNVTVIGKGFLVGSPLIRYLREKTSEIRVGDSTTPYIGAITTDADVVISAVGKSNLIRPNMVKKGVVLIDAGTSEAGGALSGDIDPKAYSKASFYTPVPGGIGPVTVAMLFRNLVAAAERKK